MRTSRLLGASLTTLLAAGLVGAATPHAAAGDNDRSDWSGQRVVQTPGAAEGPVNDWSLVAREVAPNTWRLREHQPGDGNAFSDPVSLPPTVTSFRYDESPDGTTFIAYEHEGKVYVAEHHDAQTAATLVTEVAPVAAGAPAPVVEAGLGDTALVAYAGTWAQHASSSASGGGWVTYPDPDVDGTPGTAGQSFGVTTGGDVLAFWNGANGDLRVARRAVSSAAQFSAPQTIAEGEKAIRYVETAQGGRLVTQSTDGSVNLFAYSSDINGFSFTDKRVLAGALADAPEPQVLVDALGTLTVGWRETGVAGGGLVLWQQGRPESTFLERPSLVPGTRDSEARVVSSPRGSRSRCGVTTRPRSCG